MTRWIICAIVLASAVAGCGGPADDRSAESVASVQQAASTCKNYDGYTAALAEVTIACLGAIGPRDYTDSGQGLLVPTFDRCPAEVNPPKGESPAMLRIKRLLSLQQRRETLPQAVPCIRDAYMIAAKNLIGNGVEVCPNWHKVFVGGVPSKRNASIIVKRMPFPHPKDGQSKLRVIDPPKPGSGFRFPKAYSFYTVSFDDPKGPPDQKCGRAEDCAKACATLFEGFFIGRFGKYVVGDPYWWLDPTDYGGFDPFNDPYNRVNGFYHPMSLAGDDVPGEIYGDFARGAFENPSTDDPDGVAEECTRWDGGGFHVVGRLLQDILDPKDPSTWMTRCEFYPPSLL